MFKFFILFELKLFRDLYKDILIIGMMNLSETQRLAGGLKKGGYPELYRISFALCA